ncbi:hypothetical protein [Pseudoalteromonas maricaloris]|uniref:hypothetical protein n=1 Tax=Pseudoalteromonas maricaloris TaxID=184924 RepID=UPI00057F6B73|nr:hypothetical protein [Pseudoalteromonas flavipulchra]KID33402.1 hypothetical protein QT15_23580 [Pseudoalteromonas flavipulchra NCIMB 2033 = ATCC BAA-314]MBD0781947.1 hypothetical protein [Pseudoalteromonas flavipulchra]
MNASDIFKSTAIKQVFRGTYNGNSPTGGYVPIPEINPNKSVIILNTIPYYNSHVPDSETQPSASHGYVTGRIESSTSIFLRNDVRMLLGTRPDDIRYVPIDWEVIEYV